MCLKPPDKGGDGHHFKLIKAYEILSMIINAQCMIIIRCFFKRI